MRLQLIKKIDKTHRYEPYFSNNWQQNEKNKAGRRNQRTGTRCYDRRFPAAALPL